MRFSLTAFATASAVSGALALVSVPPIVCLKIDSVHTDLAVLRHTMEQLKARGSQLPDNSVGLAALTTEPKLLEKIPADRWGHEYIYRRAPNADGYVIYSSGRDGLDAQGERDDITDRSKHYSCEEYGVGCPHPEEWVFIGACAATLLSLLGAGIKTIFLAVGYFKRRGAA